MTDFSIPEVFWTDERTMPIWREKADEALAALAVNDIVVLSGRFGTGKSRQFGSRVRQELTPSTYIDDPHHLSRTPLETSVVVDEVSSFVENRRDRARIMAKSLKGKKSILIFPGASEEIRRNMVSILTESTTDARVHHIDDVATAHVESEMAARALHALGATDRAIELVGDTPALRNPRIFSGLFFDGLGAAKRRGEQFGASDIQSTVQVLVGRAASHTQLHDTAVGGVLDELGPLARRHAHNHPLFHAGSVSTAETIQLYELADAVLPDSSYFDKTQLKIGFHPYKKN